MVTNRSFVMWFRWAMLLCVMLAFGQAHAQEIIISGRLCTPDTTCKNNSAFFADAKKADSRNWTVQGNGLALTRLDSTFSYQFTNPGDYVVTLTRTVGGVAQTPVDTNIRVGVPPPPFRQWRNDTIICKGQTLELDPYPGGGPSGATYLWAPNGKTDQKISVIDTSGCYSVEVTLNGCTYQDRINVRICGDQSDTPGAKWYFGSNAGLDFMGGGGPTPIDDSKLNTNEGSSSISNTKGQLLFYTDGRTVYNRDGAVMPFKNPADAGPLGGSSSSTQSAIIVPQPVCKGCEYLYHIYTTTEINGTKTLTYSVVDMRENNGKGAITKRNVPLNAPGITSTERIASVRNDRDSTYWVITRDFNSNNFRVYHMTPQGLSEPKNYALGEIQTKPSEAEGYLKIGPADTSGTGNRPVAMIVPGPPQNYVELFTFNDSTGTLQFDSRINLGNSPPTAYGVEFSPDGKKMYVSYRGDGTAPSRIDLFDVSDRKDSSAIVSSRTELSSSNVAEYGALQIGPDGRIYLAVKGAGSLGVIDNANDDPLTGGATFLLTGQPLASGTRSQLGLPNMVSNFTQPPSTGASFSFEGTCAESPTVFSTSPPCDPLKSTYFWNFGDGTVSSPSSATSTQVSHTYKQTANESDTYKVILYISTFQPDGTLCRRDTVEKDVTIFKKPDDINLGPDINACKNSVTLDAKVKAKRYVWLWKPSGQARFTQLRSDTTSKLTVYAERLPGTRRITPGEFIVIAANEDCFKADTIAVRLTKPPVVSLGPDRSICEKSVDTLRVRGQWDEFNWSTGSTNREIYVDKAGTYYVTVVSKATGCENSDTIKLDTQPAPRMRLQSTLAKCSVPNSGSISATVEGGRPNKFTWLDATRKEIAATQNLPAVNGGLYYLRSVNDSGCVSLDSIRVLVDSTGYVNLGPDRSQCAGDTILLQSLIARAPGDVYLWTGVGGVSDTSRTFPAQQTGTYRLKVNNTLTGCRGTDEIAVSFIAKPDVDAGPQLTVCTNQKGYKIANARPLGGVWRGRSITPSGELIGLDTISTRVPLKVFYTVTQAGCKTEDSTVVFLEQPPVISLGPDTTLCPTPAFQLQARLTPLSPAATYRWSTGETRASIRPPSTGVYSATAVVGACSVSDTVRLTFKPLPIYSLTKEVALCVGDNGTATLRVVPANQQQLTYLWLNSRETGTVISVSRVGDYPVDISNDAGCTVRDTAAVLDLCEPRVQIPDAFTPNNDGTNDLLDVFYSYVTDFELKIYNRWGEVIFVSKDPEVKWDGTYKGEKYPAMLYPYTVSYKSLYFPERPAVVRRGSVLLIR